MGIFRNRRKAAVDETEQKLVKHKMSLKKKIILITGIVLVVVAVIISIFVISNAVSNNRITQDNQIKTQTLQSRNNARTVKRLLDAYNNAKGQYPDTVSSLTLGGTLVLPRGIKLLDTTTDKLSEANGLTTVWYQYTGVAGSATGGRIQYWDYNTNKISKIILYLGDAKFNSTFSNIQP